MKLPTQEQCLQYFEEYHVPENIKIHCLKVQEVANFIALNFKEKEINKELISKLAILHDVFKMIAITDFGTGSHKDATLTEEQKKFWQGMKLKHPSCYEGQLASEIFKDDFPELALALKHVSDPQNVDPSWEELIVHYADVRVFKNEVVTFDERWHYLRERYPREDGVWESCREFQYDLEKKLFQHLPFMPKELKQKMETSQ
ncbi:HD domain-containing protein [Candidatus Woesearchaeota archaeon]|mgnify:CR=1 FL=1|jgi:hypothetical protein|nr:HD domain-containing protein [Candidatus Woesearchaeota archaeon]MBT4150501.1 HD domain-containing protein [Candidatus Woesearchaeota archaeon]MBT4247141.1 HD domain-containing protein [Candidatus Woesearchaeota archaeon]MBT4434633.1 HD domain-containing protein [Candidatus Woesearchaeota archaeon]